MNHDYTTVSRKTPENIGFVKSHRKIVKRLRNCEVMKAGIFYRLVVNLKIEGQFNDPKVNLGGIFREPKVNLKS